MIKWYYSHNNSHNSLCDTVARMQAVCFSFSKMVANETKHKAADIEIYRRSLCFGWTVNKRTVKLLSKTPVRILGLLVTELLILLQYQKKMFAVPLWIQDTRLQPGITFSLDFIHHQLNCHVTLQEKKSGVQCRTTNKYYFPKDPFRSRKGNQKGGKKRGCECFFNFYCRI